MSGQRVSVLGTSGRRKSTEAEAKPKIDKKNYELLEKQKDRRARQIQRAFYSMPVRQLYKRCRAVAAKLYDRSIPNQGFASAEDAFENLSLANDYERSQYDIKAILEIWDDRPEEENLDPDKTDQDEDETDQEPILPNASGASGGLLNPDGSLAGGKPADPLASTGQSDPLAAAAQAAVDPLAAVAAQDPNFGAVSIGSTMREGYYPLGLQPVNTGSTKVWRYEKRDQDELDSIPWRSQHFRCLYNIWIAQRVNRAPRTTVRVLLYRLPNRDQERVYTPEDSSDDEEEVQKGSLITNSSLVEYVKRKRTDRKNEHGFFDPGWSNTRTDYTMIDQHRKQTWLREQRRKREQEQMRMSLGGGTSPTNAGPNAGKKRGSTQGGSTQEYYTGQRPKAPPGATPTARAPSKVPQKKPEELDEEAYQHPVRPEQMKISRIKLELEARHRDVTEMELSMTENRERLLQDLDVKDKIELESNAEFIRNITDEIVPVYREPMKYHDEKFEQIVVPYPDPAAEARKAALPKGIINDGFSYPPVPGEEGSTPKAAVKNKAHALRPVHDMSLYNTEEEDFHNHVLLNPPTPGWVPDCVFHVAGRSAEQTAFSLGARRTVVIDEDLADMMFDGLVNYAKIADLLEAISDELQQGCGKQGGPSAEKNDMGLVGEEEDTEKSAEKEKIVPCRTLALVLPQKFCLYLSTWWTHDNTRVPQLNSGEFALYASGLLPVYSEKSLWRTALLGESYPGDLRPIKHTDALEILARYEVSQKRIQLDLGPPTPYKFSDTYCEDWMFFKTDELWRRTIGRSMAWPGKPVDTCDHIFNESQRRTAHLETHRKDPERHYRFQIFHLEDYQLAKAHLDEGLEEIDAKKQKKTNDLHLLQNRKSMFEEVETKKQKKTNDLRLLQNRKSMIVR